MLAHGVRLAIDRAGQSFRDSCRVSFPGSTQTTAGSGGIQLQKVDGETPTCTENEPINESGPTNSRKYVYDRALFGTYQV